MTFSKMDYSKTIPHATEQLSPGTITTETCTPWSPRSATREATAIKSPRTPTKGTNLYSQQQWMTHCSQKNKHINKKLFFKVRKKECLSYRRVSIRLRVDFSSEILHAKREWDDICKMLKEKKNAKQEILYPTKLSFRGEGEILSLTKVESSLPLNLP